MAAVVIPMMPVPPTGQGLDGLMTVNLARYRPSGEHVAIRRIDLESCTNDMVAYLQVRVTGLSIIIMYLSFGCIIVHSLM